MPLKCPNIIVKLKITIRKPNNSRIIFVTAMATQGETGLGILGFKKKLNPYKLNEVNIRQHRISFFLSVIINTFSPNTLLNFCIFQSFKKPPLSSNLLFPKNSGPICCYSNVLFVVVCDVFNTVLLCLL